MDIWRVEIIEHAHDLLQSEESLQRRQGAILRQRYDTWYSSPNAGFKTAKGGLEDLQIRVILVRADQSHEGGSKAAFFVDPEG